VLRRIFGPKRAGGCRSPHNEELYDMYVSQSIVMVIKSREMK
jgi:hypothetical protein